MNEKSWLDAATKKIRFGPDRKAVRRELEAHLEDLREASGLEREAALEAMGDPEDIAEELGRVHRPWLGYLWRLSQIALIGAAAVYCLLLALLAVRPGYSYRVLPGMHLYNYLQTDVDMLDPARVIEARELPAGAAFETGGYTIRPDQVVFRQVSETDGPQWNLYIELDITLSRWEEPLDYWFALSGVRTGGGPPYGMDQMSAYWGFWQKCGLEFKGLPEDAEWVELDFGYGELKRTLHIDLTEEAET